MLPTPTPSLTRTSSATSVSSCEDVSGCAYMDATSSFTSIGSAESSGTADNNNNTTESNGGNGSGNGTLAPRRTRKRFSNIQLSMLENLFHQNSHPSREEREELAARGDMEVKSVTIWFQNKRQMERKVALNNASNATSTNNHSSSQHTHKDAHHHHRSRTLSHPSVLSASSSRTSARPTLDTIATRAEQTPRTPKRSSRTYESTGAIYDNMPSSPPGSSPMSLGTRSSLSPHSRDFVAFGKMQKTRTLEWACAAARLHGAERKERSHSRSRKHSEKRSSKDHHHHHRSSHHHHHSTSSSSKDKDKERKGLERRHSYAAFPTLSSPLSTPPEPMNISPAPIRRNSATDRLSMVDITSELSDVRSRDDEVDDDDDASTTADEATTPPGTLAGDDVRWRKDSSGRYTASSSASIQSLLSMERGTTVVGPGGSPMNVDDDDMKAALLLCGLGRPQAGLRR